VQAVLRDVVCEDVRAMQFMGAFADCDSSDCECDASIHVRLSFVYGCVNERKKRCSEKI